MSKDLGSPKRVVEDGEVGERGERVKEREAHTKLTCALCLTTAKSRPKVEDPRANIKAMC